MTPEELDEYLDQHDDLARADGTPIDRDEFLDDLKRIRDLGYSQAYGERVPGMASIAAPVIDPQGTAIAAVQVAGQDRKSTRLNSSHANISNAVFCLKKKQSAWMAMALL